MILALMVIRIAPPELFSFNIGAITLLDAAKSLEKLHEINILNRAQVAIMGSAGIVSTKKINDKGTGYVYIGTNTELQMDTHLESCTQVYNGGILTIKDNGTSRFAIKRHIDVYGRINGSDGIDLFFGSNAGNWTMHPSSSPRKMRFRSLTVQENSGIILDSNESEIAWKIEADADRDIEFKANSLLLSSNFDSIKGKKISFQKGSKAELNENSGRLSHFQADRVFTEGTLELGAVKFGSTLRKFHVGGSGYVHVSTSEFSLKEFICEGSMIFVNDTGISTDTWTVGPTGNVAFRNAKRSIVLQTHTLKVNGVFNPGKLSTGTGWQLLEVGPAGLFTFSSNTTVIIDQLEVSGTVKVNGTISLQKRDFSGKSLINITSGGKFFLDGYSPCVNRSKYSGVSELLALNVTVNGIFHVGKMSLGPGWDNLHVGPNGDVAFIPSGHVKIDRIAVAGNLRTDTISVLKSKSSGTEEVETFEIDSTGTVELNCSPDNTGNLANYTNATAKDHASQLFAKTVRIDGSFVARKLYMGLGWDNFSVGATGHFTVYPIGWFSFDKCDLNGKMTSQGHLEIQGKSLSYLTRLHVGSSGHLKSIVGATDIFVDDLLVEGKFETGLLSIGRGIKSLSVTGSISFNHTKEFNINVTTINGTLETWTPFTSSGRFLGQQLDVNGVIKVNYQGVPQEDDGLTPSILLVDVVSVQGSAYFGSLDLTSNDVSIAGLLSADNGGALGNKGKGTVH